MRRRLIRILHKWGIPSEKRMLVFIGLTAVIFFVLSQPVIARVADVILGGFWSGRFTFSIPYEKQENDRMTRQGVFEGEAFWNSVSGCWELRGKTKESFNSYGDSGMREVKTRRDCSLEVVVK
mgnify:CR=1 FL=1